MKIMLKNKKYQKILKNRVYVNDQSILTITITITTNKTLPTNKTLTRGKINNNIYLLHSNYDGLLGLICSVNIIFIKTKRGKRFVKTFLFCFTFFSFIFLRITTWYLKQVCRFSLQGFCVCILYCQNFWSRMFWSV